MTRWARSRSSHRSGTAACRSSSATCSRIRPGSRTCSTLVSVWFSALISASTSRAATSVKATRHGDDPVLWNDHVHHACPYITRLAGLVMYAFAW